MDPKHLSSAVLRPVGLMEKFSTVRHNLGLYRCVQNIARYSSNQSHDTNDLLATLETALAKVILRHPSLCCAIIDEDKEDPAFVRLESVDLSKCIDYRKSDSSTSEEYEQSLIEIIEHQHRQIWPDIHCQPPWKLIVIRRKALPSDGTVFDAIFAWHHAIADGLSGMVFHRSLQEALNDLVSIKIVSHTIKIPESSNLFPPQEDMIKFKISWWFLLSAVWHKLRPKWLLPDSSPPWTAAPVAPTTEGYDPHVKLISVSSEQTVSILAACREHQTTLTGLLQALIASSLSYRVPNANSFVSTTPSSPRHISGISSTSDIAVQVCSHSYTFTPNIVSAIRTCSSPTQITSQVWEISRAFRVSLAAEIARLPVDNVAGLLPYAGSIHRMFLSKLGNPREDTFQVSNIGAFKNEVCDGQWRIERMFFTQCGLAGSAFTFNSASVVGGPLIISVTWSGGDFEDELMGKIIVDVRCALQSIAEGREVSLGLLD